jgi:capsule biosynthesis phosphatase
MQQTYIVDIDDTVLTTPLREDGTYDYDKSTPLMPVIEKLRLVKEAGHTIILFTARGMRTFKGNVKKIKEAHEARLIKFMKEHDVPYDELIMGKAWGPNPIYIDNRNLSLHAFVTSNPEFFENIIKAENQI